MDFEKDLFISYSHIDNQPLSREQQGWVSQFHKDLETMLSMRLGAEVKIWRDTKLQGNDIFNDEIVQQFPDTALFVSVLSPRYVRSEWCTREINEFCRVAKQSIGLIIDNKARIFKVIKTPVENQEPLPAEVRSVLGYEFFTYDEQERALELDPAFGQEISQAYLRKLNALAWDIVDLLKSLERDAGAARGGDSSTVQPALPVPATPAAEPAPDVAPQPAASDKPVVYLAESSYDRREEREIVAAELKAHGYTVLPDREMPRLEAAYVAEVDRMLAESQLSVHLVGQSYGAVPDGPSQKSVVELQNERAVAASKAGGLQRILWVPEGLASEQAAQQSFLDKLARNAEAQHGADVITGSVTALKTAIHGQLDALQQPPAVPAAEAGSQRMVYVICDEKDRRNTLPLLRALKERGFEVKLPLFAGEANAVRQAHTEYLTACDGVILFYGAGDEGWKFTKESELKKMRAYRADRPDPAVFTYLAEPATPDKEILLELEEPGLIDGLGGFREDALQAFLQAIAPHRA